MITLLLGVCCLVLLVINGSLIAVLLSVQDELRLRDRQLAVYAGADAHAFDFPSADEDIDA